MMRRSAGRGHLGGLSLGGGRASIRGGGPPSVPDGRCVRASGVGGEQPGQALARPERVGDHHVAGGLQPRLGRERQLPGAGLQFAQGRGQGQRIARELGARGVRLVLAGAADGELDHPGRDRPEDHDQQHAQEAGALVVVGAAYGNQPGEVDEEHHDGGQGARDGGDEDVAVVDMAQLMADDAAQLAFVEQLEDAVGAADRGVAGVAAGGEGVGRLGRGEVQARHGPAGRRGELADHAVELWRLELADRAGAHGAQGELVAVPVRVGVGAQGDDDGDDQARTAEQAADDDDEGGQSPEEYGGPEPVVPAVHGTPSKRCGRGTLCCVAPLTSGPLLTGQREMNEPGSPVRARRGRARHPTAPGGGRRRTGGLGAAVGALEGAGAAPAR